MMLKNRRIAVVGGGVIGLSVAHRLLDQEAAVTVFSPQPLSDITSSVAAAYWAPYWVGDYDHSIATGTLTQLQRLARSKVDGVAEFSFEEWLTEEGARELDQEIETAYWWRNLPGINFVRESMESSSPIVFQGQEVRFVEKVRFTSVVARMPDYLAWLERRLVESPSVFFERQWVDCLDSICDGNRFDFVVNCTGWGAKSLVQNDPDTAQMRLLAGHVVIVDAPAISSAISLSRSPFRGAPVYVVPRSGSRRDVLCGGTAIDVTESLNPRERVTYKLNEKCDDVLERTSSVLPSVRGRSELERGVGIRPMRKSVRIERDAFRDDLVHCYGHGGSGLTLSWGSADRVVEILAAGC